MRKNKTPHKVTEAKAPHKVKKYQQVAHNISPSQVSDNAIKVLRGLKKTGYQAYLVGGCVRDLLLKREPKDFDVVTDASPEQVRKVFYNCRFIGKRFRLVHVYFGRDIIEVATFRGSDDMGKRAGQRIHQDGRLLRDNIFGTIEDDVWRRDFTVNALYYNVCDSSVLDYTDGMDDHAAGILRLIGDPLVRYQEDPVRMLRAVRFSVKLGFQLEEATEKALFVATDFLKNVPAARLYDETLKLFLSGQALQTFEMLRHYGLFAVLFPQTEQCLTHEKNSFTHLFISKALQNSDNRIAQGKSVTPYFFLAVFLWGTLQKITKKLIKHDIDAHTAYQEAMNIVISQQRKSLTIPKRVTQSMCEVWQLQSRFYQKTGARPFKLMALPRFRAAYDFLLLRAETHEVKQELAQWWRRFQEVDEVEQQRMTQFVPKNDPSKTNQPKVNAPQNNQPKVNTPQNNQLTTSNKQTPSTASNKQTPVMTEVYIGLGSNLQQPVTQIKQARIAIAEQALITELKFSSLYSSPPMGPPNQPDYVNAVMKITTSLTAFNLLAVLQNIENQQGRVRHEERWKARTLDLDLLLFADQQIEHADLIVPHIGLSKRAFVLYPLQEIAPKDLHIPHQGLLTQLLAQCDLQGLKKIV